ncbi:excinuclease Cho [Kluyvera genomosp. 1]|uniref:excinuclease Cho n=1 Tax=Kluyvera genomosp. 1 TaxID=2774053 RepID=UPI000692192A|nr:excinuclease Cho [Kluyvera genomosp. 1]
MINRRVPVRSENDQGPVYQYPEHLRPILASIPKVPGVYIFHGDSESLPLYIGKSINIRSRVMSHFRTTQEASLLQQTRRISWHPTAGELGALLLEARLIKEQQPLFNKRLRRNRQLCSLRLNGTRPEIVYARDIDFSRTPHLFGLFANRRAALDALKTVADEQKLCYSVMGLEPVNHGRACFRSMLGRCAGACCGREAIETHHARLYQALAHLQVLCWPWEGAVALEEQGEFLTQYHVIHNWFWLGAVSSLTDVHTLSSVASGFDHDGYKTLCRPMLSGNYPIHIPE